MVFFAPSDQVDEFRAALCVSATAPPVEMAPPPHFPWDYHEFEGTVTALDRDSITVQGLDFELSLADVRAQRDYGERFPKVTYTSVSGKPFIFRCPAGWLPSTRAVVSGQVMTVTAPDGTMTVFRKSDATPLRFRVSDWLAAGGYDPALRHTDIYPLSEVRLGDRVRLRNSQTDMHCQQSAYVCREVSIRRRPGGKIPPAWGEKPNALYKHHERMQAYQDWEEKGVPLPDYLHPGGPWPQLAPPPRGVHR
jgi:hypothetical protein